MPMSGGSSVDRKGRGPRICSALLLLLIASLLALGLAPAPTQAAGCRFTLGFEELHDLLPTTVGNCLADEQHDGRTGDAVQPTTGANGRGGLLVWRRADNDTAFTDGYHTWVNGPFGVQQRLNTERFPWESDPTPASPTTQRPLLGVNLHPLQNVYAIYPPDRVLDRAVEAGASVVRIDVHWDWLEWTGPGAERWDPGQVQRLNAFLDAAHRRNLRVLAVVTDTPCWASSDPTKACESAQPRYDFRAPPSDPRDFAGFLMRLVTRYRGRIQYWEIWNEPNLPQFWTHPDPVVYTGLLRAAYPAIKASDPTAVVLAGALAPVEPGAPGVDTLGFVDAMYRAGARGFFDGLSFHPYTNGQSPTADQPGLPVHSFARSVPALHLAMLRAGDSRPIWLTESGWPTTPSCAACGSGRSFTSEADQATFLAEEIRLVRGWDYVQGLVWYEMFDRGTSAGNAEDHFGLFRHDLSPKPAVSVFRALSRGEADAR